METDVAPKQPFWAEREHADRVLAASDLLLKTLWESGLDRFQCIAALKIATKLFKSSPHSG